MPWVELKTQIEENGDVPTLEVAKAAYRLTEALESALESARESVALEGEENDAMRFTLARIRRCPEAYALWQALCEEAAGKRVGRRPARGHGITVCRAAPKVGRNVPCPCGSGLKFKKCHGREQ
jgi:uncharacterized protein YecA (UPF0149 family)